MDKKKPQQPELIEDKDLDETSGGTLAGVGELKASPPRPPTQKIEIGALKAG
jgi:hypothetical protein